MHHASTPAPAGAEGFHAGCGAAAPHIALSVWFNFAGPSVVTSALQSVPVQPFAPLEPPPVTRRPARAPPRRNA